MLLLGRFIEMEEAMRLGLVTEVLELDDLEKRAYELAHKLAKGPTQAYGAIKNARNQGLGLDPIKGFEAQILANVELMFHKDAREGPRAFKEGREPNFTAEWIDLQYDQLRPYE
jgi:2-(1,2-epoxy-1,2-dihydrophenyl)acetyl-CoA isomerase